MQTQQLQSFIKFQPLVTWQSRSNFIVRVAYNFAFLKSVFAVHFNESDTY